MAKTNKSTATPVETKPLESLSLEELLQFAKQVGEKLAVAEGEKTELIAQLKLAKEKISAAEEKVAAVTKDATETINSLSIEVAKHTSKKQFNHPVVKHGKNLVALTVPVFNLNGKDFVSSEIQDDDPVLDELAEMGSNIYHLTTKSK